MKPIRIQLAPRTASATVLAATQTPGTSALTLTATAANIDPQAGTPLGLGRIVTITSGGNDSGGLTWAVVGVDENGQAASETVTGVNAAVAVTTKYYTSITSITPSVSVATTASAGVRGTTASAALGCLPLDPYGRIGATVQVDVSGTISYTVQHTYDDCLNSAATLVNNTYFATPATPTALTAQSTAKYCQLPPGTCGISVTIPTYSTNGYIVVNVISPSNSNLG